MTYVESHVLYGPMQELVTSREAADILCVTRETVWRWETKGRLRSIRVGPRGWRKYRRTDVEALRDRGEVA